MNQDRHIPPDDAERQDLYKTPDPSRSHQGEQQFKEPSLLDLRARMIKTTLVIFVLMMIMLTATLIYFAVTDPGKDEEDIPDYEAQALAMMQARVNTNTLADILAEQNLLEPTRTAERREKVSANPQELAEAKREIRRAGDYARAEEWIRAEEHALRALQIYPGMLDAMRVLGMVYTQQGRFDRAILILERAIEQDPFSAELYNNLAAAYLHRSRMQKAEELLYTALSLDPEHHVAYLNLGLLYMATGRYPASADSFEKALQAMPDNLAARNNLAVALIRCGRLPEAREHLQRIIRMNEDEKAAYFNMAIAYMYEQNLEQTFEWLKKAAGQCSPMEYQQFLSDRDFDPIRDMDAFKVLMKMMYPSLPELPPEPDA